METDEPSRPGRGILLALGVVGILIGALIAAELAIPLQPSIGGNNTQVILGGPKVDMPPGVGANLQENYAPDTIAVVIGFNNTITFSNLDTAIHTVTATDGSFDSGNIAAGASWNYTFTKAGTFTYKCIYHAWMKGTVVVKSGAGLALAVVKLPAGVSSNTKLSYQPQNFVVIIGINNTVTFQNLDTATHTVTSSGNFDSGDIHAGMSWTHVFGTPGTYHFKCIYHFWMTGTITVVAPA